MALNIGVNVLEVDGRAVPTIQAAPTSVAAFLGLTERGIPNLPKRVTNLQQFTDQFGNHRNDSNLAYAVQGFFMNGGREAYIARTVGPGSVPATLTLNDRQSVPADTLRVSAGYRGVADPGDWGERIRVDVREDGKGATTLATPIVATDTNARLTSLNGLEVGSVVRFIQGTTTLYRKITALSRATNTIQWMTPIGVSLTTGTTAVMTAEFRLIVRYRAVPTSDFAIVEDWRRLSMETDSADYVIGRINHPFTGSRHIMLTDLSGTAPSGEENPAVVSSQALLNGTENPASPSDYGVALLALDTKFVQLVAAPDVHFMPPAGRLAAVRNVLDYCASRGDCMFVGAPPDRGSSPGTMPRMISDYTQLESAYLISISQYAANFRATKVYGALYAPWVQVNDPIGPGPAPSRFVPPDGHIMGVFARTELERGIFKAPAGDAAVIRGALGTAAGFTDGEHASMVRESFVNGIRFREGTGIVVAASRTLSSDTRWWFVNVRLLFNFVKSSLREGLRFVRQEPHTSELRRRVSLNVVTPFLLGLWRQGAFGSDPPEAVFSVKCDEENNPPAEVNLGNFKIEVYFYPVKPAETILIIVGQQPSLATTSEA